MQSYRFSDDFIFGTTTSAIQIESAVDHEWKGMRAFDDSVLEKTVQHELHMMDDARLISTLGNGYRFSMQWSKLQPSAYSELETKAVDEYRNFLGALKDNNVHLMLVLHHFENPNWLAKKGGWLSDKVVPVFTDYTKKMVSCFGDLIDTWITINEPSTYIGFSYIFGETPPYRKNAISEGLKILKNMGNAHNSSYNAIKEKLPGSMVGISNWINTAKGHGILGKLGEKLFDYLFYRMIPDHFNNQADFLGINYYGLIPFMPNPLTECTTPGELGKLGIPHDDMWAYSPEGILLPMQRFSDRYGKKPIFITENGYCGNNDDARISSIKGHLSYIFQAIGKGMDIRGYFHWTTMDNFEHRRGYAPKFGLYAVDLKTMERKIKKSGEFYSQIARTKTLQV